MTRFKAVPVAIAAIALSAGVAFAYKALPEAAATGLDTATEAAKRTVPARPGLIEHIRRCAAAADARKPDDPGPPDSVDLPDAAPEDPGPPADAGKPDEPGRPN